MDTPPNESSANSTLTSKPGETVAAGAPPESLTARAVGRPARRVADVLAAGRVALVTGVSRRVGIGMAVARRLAGLGADLFVTSWSQHDREQPWGADPGGLDAVLAELGGGDAPGAGRVELRPNPHRFAAFHVLRRADTPAVLFEAGYLSNADDEAMLRQPVTRSKMVLALAQAIEADVAARSRR